LLLHGLVFALMVEDVDWRRCGALYIQMIVERRLTSRRKAPHIKRGSVEVDRFVRAGKMVVSRALQKSSRRAAEPIHRRDWRLSGIDRLRGSSPNVFYDAASCGALICMVGECYARLVRILAICVGGCPGSPVGVRYRVVPHKLGSRDLRHQKCAYSER